MTTPQPPTLDELRDWHYRRKALSDLGKPLSEMPWAEQHWDDKHCRVVDERLNNHPFPPTLDGAASAMPEGWEWRRCMFTWIASKQTPKETISVSCSRTAEEKYDRYLLAKLAHKRETNS